MKAEHETIERELRELAATARRMPGGVTLFAHEAKTLYRAARMIEGLRVRLEAQERANPISGRTSGD